MRAVTVIAEMTAAEFLALPLRPEGIVHRELVDGELVVNQPSWTHNQAQGNLFFALKSWAREGPERGSVALPLDVLFDERNVYEPDVAWYRHDRAPTGDSSAPYAIPDLAVELRSPSTWRLNLGVKKSTYERDGLPELWLVGTTAGSVVVFRRSAPGAPCFDVSLELPSSDTLTSALLPGFSLPVGEIFGR